MTDINNLINSNPKQKEEVQTVAVAPAPAQVATAQAPIQVTTTTPDFNNTPDLNNDKLGSKIKQDSAIDLDDIFNNDEAFRVLDKKELTKFNDLPVGTYNVEVLNTELKTIQSTGKPFITITYKVISGDQKDRVTSQSFFLYNKQEQPNKVSLQQLIQTVDVLTGPKVVLENKLQDIVKVNLPQIIGTSGELSLAFTTDKAGKEWLNKKLVKKLNLG